MSDIMPSQLQRVDVKDLSKGMNSTAPSTSLPAGTFIDAKHLYAMKQGLQRRNAWRLFFRVKEHYGKIPFTYDDEIVTDLEGFFDYQNSLQLLAFTNRRLYVNEVGDGFSPVPYGLHRYDIASVSGNEITCDSVASHGFVTDSVITGDYVRTYTSAGVLIEEIKVNSVDSEVKLTVASGPTGSWDYLEVIREFDMLPDEIVDFTFMPKGVVIVDGSLNGILKYTSDADGPCLSNMHVHGNSDDVSDGNEFYLKGAKTCHFFNGYLILGNTTERYSESSLDSDLDQKRTVRWSSVTDISEFAVIDYVIFTREMSSVIKVTSSEECPVVFMDNAIYFGTPSDLEGLPYKYERVETGAVSAVGKRAMCSIPGGMAFIGVKNIYAFELAKQGTRVPVITPIGDPIFNRSCYENDGPKSSRALFSPEQNSLVCCFPKRKHRVGNMFYLNFDTKSWSYVEDESSRFACANVFPYYILIRWSDADSQPWTDYDSYSWFSLKMEDYTSRVFVVDTLGYVYVSDDSYDWDEAPDENEDISQVQYECVVETGDLDFGSPGIYKLVNNVLLTLSDVATRERTTDINVKIEVSTDRGKSWQEKTTLLIESGTFTEDASFRATGEVIRFRFTFEEGAPLFILSEIEFRLRAMGSFNQRGPA